MFTNRLKVKLSIILWSVSINLHCGKIANETVITSDQHLGLTLRGVMYFRMNQLRNIMNCGVDINVYVILTYLDNCTFYFLLFSLCSKSPHLPRRIRKLWVLYILRYIWCNCLNTTTAGCEHVVWWSQSEKTLLESITTARIPCSLLYSTLDSHRPLFDHIYNLFLKNRPHQEPFLDSIIHHGAF